MKIDIFYQRKAVLFIVSMIVMGSMISCTAGAPFYLVKQGFGQARILLSRVSVDQLIKEANNPKQASLLTSDQREKLLFIKQIRQYAKDRWHLKDTDSFQSYVKIDGDSISYLVMAAPSLKLQPKRWWFPIVGDVPYLGFFKIEDADNFEQYLKNQGYDTYRSTAAAYSTLGWFSDPVFSSQLGYSKLYLCGLVVHEMVHSTIWVKGYPEFNEAIASFVEDKAREAYFQDIEGPNSPTLKIWHSYNQDEVQLNQIIDKYQHQLNSIYDSTLTDEAKQTEKINVLNELKNSLRNSKDQFQIMNTNELANQEWNNARLTSRSVYRSDWPQFENVFNECNQNLNCFLETYSNLAKTLKENLNMFVRDN